MKSRLFSPSFLTLFFGASLVVGVALISQAPAQAPYPGNRGGGERIAVIDVKYILENHHRFQDAMDGLKKEFESVSKSLNEERQHIVSMTQQLGELNPNTPDYNRLEEDIARAKANWAIKAEKHKKEFRNKESQFLWNVYQEVQRETERYCKTNSIGLVIQFNGEPVDNNKPADVFQGITRPIVYNAPHLDITPRVLAALNTGTQRVGERNNVGRDVGVPPRQFK